VADHFVECEPDLAQVRADELLAEAEDPVMEV
jgi:hypothetical protein